MQFQTRQKTLSPRVQAPGRMEEKVDAPTAVSMLFPTTFWTWSRLVGRTTFLRDFSYLTNWTHSKFVQSMRISRALNKHQKSPSPVGTFG
jgi:hypothetical protein